MTNDTLQRQPTPLVLIGRQFASQKRVLALRGGESVLEGGHLGPVPGVNSLSLADKARTAAEIESAALGSASGRATLTGTVLLRVLVILGLEAGCR